MEQQKPFPFRAANASCMAGLIAWIFPVMLRGGGRTLTGDEARTYAIVIGVASILIMSVGMALAIAAFRGVRQHGRNGIVVPATLGLLINCLGIALFILGFISAARSA